eukprot:122376-Chlamydomonas_euryale.AAC.1
MLSCHSHSAATAAASAAVGTARTLRAGVLTAYRPMKMAWPGVPPGAGRTSTLRKKRERPAARAAAWSRACAASSPNAANLRCGALSAAAALPEATLEVLRPRRVLLRMPEGTPHQRLVGARGPMGGGLHGVVRYAGRCHKADQRGMRAGAAAAAASVDTAWYPEAAAAIAMGKAAADAAAAAAAAPTVAAVSVALVPCGTGIGVHVGDGGAAWAACAVATMHTASLSTLADHAPRHMMHAVLHTRRARPNRSVQPVHPVQRISQHGCISTAVCRPARGHRGRRDR